MPVDQVREALSPADASNLVFDAHDQVNVFLMAGVLGRGGFVGPDGEADLEALRAELARTLEGASPQLRRFRQRVSRSGRRLVWQECAPDLGWHVRQVEAVAGAAGLGELAGDLMTRPLPLDRPLWELLVVTGAGTGPGVVFRVHHAVADGVGVVGLVQHLFGRLPEPRAATQGVRPVPAPRRRASLRVAVARVLSVFRLAVPRTVLLGPIGPRRGMGFTQVDLASLGAGARSAGATLNDALLAAVAPALEAALEAAGAPVLQPVPVSVPVALPERGTSGNAVGVMLVRLPTGVSDLRERLARISALTSAGKAEARAQGTFELTRSQLGSRVYAFLAQRQRFIAAFVTNVRGPAERLFIAGAPLELAWPVVPLQGNVRFGVAAFSYAGRLFCTVHVDAAHLDATVAERALTLELQRIVTLGEAAGDTSA